MYCPFCGAEYTEQQQDQTFTKGILHTRLVGSVHITAHLQCILAHQSAEQIKSRIDSEIVRNYNAREAELHPKKKKIGTRAKVERIAERKAALIANSKQDLAFREFQKRLASGEITLIEDA